MRRAGDSQDHPRRHERRRPERGVLCRRGRLLQAGRALVCRYHEGRGRKLARILSGVGSVQATGSMANGWFVLNTTGAGKTQTVTYKRPELCFVQSSSRRRRPSGRSAEPATLRQARRPRPVRPRPRPPPQLSRLWWRDAAIFQGGRPQADAARLESGLRRSELRRLLRSRRDRAGEGCEPATGARMRW